MIKAKYEIRITSKSEILLLKKYSTKSEAISMYEKIPKVKSKINYPDLQLNQVNFSVEGDIIDNVTIKKNHLNINKITVDKLRDLL